MRSTNIISHEAKVRFVDNESVTVSLSPGLSCSGCAAERSCGMTGNSERLVKVEGSFDLRPGETVQVSMRGSNGYLALFLGYLLPLILVIVTLIVFTSLDNGELLSGILSLGILIPYYIILWILRRIVGKKFSFTIKTAI